MRPSRRRSLEAFVITIGVVWPPWDRRGATSRGAPPRRGSSVELPEAIASELVRAHKPRLAAQPYSAEQIRAALDKHAGVREKVWRELGMANRYVLKRLMKKYGIADD